MRISRSEIEFLRDGQRIERRGARQGRRRPPRAWSDRARAGSPSCRRPPACRGRPPTAWPAPSPATGWCAATPTAASASACRSSASATPPPTSFPLAELARPALVAPARRGRRERAAVRRRGRRSPLRRVAAVGARPALDRARGRAAAAAGRVGRAACCPGDRPRRVGRERRGARGRRGVGQRTGRRPRRRGGGRRQRQRPRRAAVAASRALASAPRWSPPRPTSPARSPADPTSERDRPGSRHDPAQERIPPRLGTLARWRGRGRHSERRGGSPPSALRITYPDALPITARRDDLLATIRDHQVVVVAGETGSGKSTQLPKLCLELGRGVDGLIGHTQPRRVAARTIAERVAEELGTPLGTDVGFSVRFDDRVGDGTLVRVMTDGILLAELQRDRDLRRYDTLIIDEAHERSLNIDFILGYLRQLLPRRPDLKVIVTSATIDTARFASHFGIGDGRRPDRRGDRPDVPGRGPLPPVRRAARRTATRCRRSATPSTSWRRPGDTLVFLSGEREIHDTADFLRRRQLPRHRDPAAVRPAVVGRAAPHLPAAPRPAHRAQHERRRDVAHRARRALRRRRRHGPDLPLQQAVEGAATADRADLAGVGEPAGRPLRPRRARHLHPPLRRGRLRRPPGVHRAGDPAHQPGQRHPADDGDRARRRRRVPVPRAARPGVDPRRRTCCSRSSARSSTATTAAPAG